jgi:hypothetical protein
MGRADALKPYRRRDSHLLIARSELPIDTVSLARYLKAVADLREVVSDPEARYFGGRVEEHSLVPLGEARLGRSVSTIGSAAHRR